MRDEYAYHQPTPDQLLAMEHLREEFSNLHDLVEALAPNSRYRSLGLTALEQAATWTNKAITLGAKGNR